MTTAFIISMLVFVIYVGGTCLLFKRIPNSVSQTYYLLKEQYGLGVLFTFFCWIVGFCLAPYMLEKSDPNLQWTAFLALAGILFVGAAPLFLDEFEGQIHKWCATLCIVFSQIWAFAHCWWIPLLCWIAYVVGTAIYMKKHKETTFSDTFLRTKPMFWVEITAFAATYLVAAII